MKRLILASLLALLARGAFASGGAILTPWALDPYGGLPADQAAFYHGRPGILLGRAPWARLFAAWRMLHGLPVGATAGKSLAVPCCGGAWGSADLAIKAWLDARARVPGAPPNPTGSIDVFRTVGDYASVQTCFPDAFLTAARTLNDRIASYGAADPWIRAWLNAQDAVFAGCSGDSNLSAPDARRRAGSSWTVPISTRRWPCTGATLPWPGRRSQRSLPMRPRRGHDLAPYLAARAAVSAALPTKDPAAFALARQRLAALEPADAYGHADRANLAGALAFRDQPDARRTELAAVLTAPALTGNVAADFKDSRRLGQSPAGDQHSSIGSRSSAASPTSRRRLGSTTTTPTNSGRPMPTPLRHARDRWAATADPGRLIAAMEWSAPGAGSDDLVAAARKLSDSDPAYLTALYHRVRLTGAPADARPDLDAALARTDLSMTDRNLLTAERVMAAADLSDLARLGARHSPCSTPDDAAPGCLSGDYGMEYTLPSRPADVRFGEEAAAVIDRLPVAERARLAETPALPAPLAFDVAFTTWVRAVLSLDYATADRLTKALRTFLPQLEPEWAAYLAAKPGEDKRFAAWFVLAKVPGADVDLQGGYTRPEGKIAEFDGHWHDWVYAPAGAPAVPPGEVTADLVCFGLCGAGAFPFRLPPFAAALGAKAAAERGRFLPASAKSTGSVWEDVLAYARAHPADPRSPEALYWLVRVSRFGTGHNRSSYRAWVLLHDRYKASAWARDSKYFYD